MAKISFASLKLKIKDEVKTVKIGDKDIEVKQYLAAEDKYSLIMITLQQCREDGYINAFKKDVFFHLNLIFMYTNFSFTDKQREDLLALYDLLESNDVIDKVIATIPEMEYNELYSSIEEIGEGMITYHSSFAGMLSGFMTQMPENAAKAAEIVDNFDEKKVSQIINIAKATGARL